MKKDWTCTNYRDEERKNLHELTHQDSPCGGLPGDEFPRPILGLRHPPDLGVRSLVEEGRCPGPTRPGGSSSWRWFHHGGRLLGSALVRHLHVLLLATAEPGDEAVDEDDDESGAKEDKAGGEEGVPVSLLDALVCWVGRHVYFI